MDCTWELKASVLPARLDDDDDDDDDDKPQKQNSELFALKATILIEKKFKKKMPLTISYIV